jgi:fumarate reductase subunit D
MRHPGEARRPDWLQAVAWAVFANTAVLTALIVPAHILAQGILGPLGVHVFDGRNPTFTDALANPFVKLYLLVLFAAVFYTAAHRARYVLPELGVLSKRSAATLLLTLATLATAVAAYLVITTP